MQMASDHVPDDRKGKDDEYVHPLHCRGSDDIEHRRAKAAPATPPPIINTSAVSSFSMVSLLRSSPFVNVLKTAHHGTHSSDIRIETLFFANHFVTWNSDLGKCKKIMLL